MPSKYTQSVTSGKTRFSKAPMAELEFSTIYDDPTLTTDFNAGDIVPIYCAEVLPHDTFKFDMDFVIRQATLAVPVMGQLVADFYAFFVPNRVVNASWKNVMGENTSGKWTAPPVSLAPLCTTNQYTDKGSCQIPVGSVADYYGLPTQLPIPVETLAQMNDLIPCGYLSCYNHYFRDENVTPPVPVSKLNIYKGFLERPEGTIYNGGKIQISVTGLPNNSSNGYNPNTVYGANNPRNAPVTLPDGSVGPGAIQQSIGGDGSYPLDGVEFYQPARYAGWSFLDKPLKASKIHDYFTSVLPSPQKGRQVSIPVLGQIPLNTASAVIPFDKSNRMQFGIDSSAETSGNVYGTLVLNRNASSHNVSISTADPAGSSLFAVNGSNLIADLENSGVSISVTDLRLSSAIQRVYEILGNGGSRYTEFVNSFFGLEVDNPYEDKPTLLGHFRRDLDLFQTAQTSATENGGNLGELGAFGYTNNGGSMFTNTFLEHGFIHVFAVVRHKNIYSSMIDKHFFRRDMLDFYSYPLANLSETPVMLRQINPFGDPEGVFGYQEAWSEYRFEPSRCTAHQRNGIGADDLSAWNYCDDFDPTVTVRDSEWTKSNTAEVVSRSTAVTDRNIPQFKAQFMFKITKERPMPVYSVPGADIF